MTHHDLLIDSITNILYRYYNDGHDGEMWDYAVAEKDAQELLVLVEEFQEKRAKLCRTANFSSQWRASD